MIEISDLRKLVKLFYEVLFVMFKGRTVAFDVKGNKLFV
jgi:hypothetical protein